MPHWVLKPSVRKVIAAMVLLWGLGDLSIPGWCQTDDQKGRSLPVHSASAVSSQDAVADVSQSAVVGVDVQQPAPDHDADSWSCCGHVSPTVPFKISALDAIASLSPDLLLPRPREFAAAPYHPPKH